MSLNFNAVTAALVVGRSKGLSKQSALKLGLISGSLAGESMTNAVMFPLLLANRFRPPPRALVRPDKGEGEDGGKEAEVIADKAAAERRAVRKTLGEMSSQIERIEGRLVQVEKPAASKPVEQGQKAGAVKK